MSAVGGSRQDTPVERVQMPRTPFSVLMLGQTKGVRCLRRLATATGNVAHEVHATDM